MLFLHSNGRLEDSFITSQITRITYGAFLCFIRLKREKKREAVVREHVSLLLYHKKERKKERMKKKRTNK